jgi:hypothetical protein
MLQGPEVAAQLEAFKAMVKEGSVSKDEVTELRKMYKDMGMVSSPYFLIPHIRHRSYLFWSERQFHAQMKAACVHASRHEAAQNV